MTEMITSTNREINQNHDTYTWELNNDKKFTKRRKDTIHSDRNIHRSDVRIFHWVNHTRLRVNAIWVLNHQVLNMC